MLSRTLVILLILMFAGSSSFSQATFVPHDASGVGIGVGFVDSDFYDGVSIGIGAKVSRRGDLSLSYTAYDVMGADVSSFSLDANFLLVENRLTVPQFFPIVTVGLQHDRYSINDEFGLNTSDAKFGLAAAVNLPVAGPLYVQPRVGYRYIIALEGPDEETTVTDVGFSVYLANPDKRYLVVTGSSSEDDGITTYGLQLTYVFGRR